MPQTFPKRKSCDDRKSRDDSSALSFSLLGWQRINSQCCPRCQVAWNEKPAFDTPAGTCCAGPPKAQGLKAPASTQLIQSAGSTCAAIHVCARASEAKPWWHQFPHGMNKLHKLTACLKSLINSKCKVPGYVGLERPRYLAIHADGPRST